MRLIIAQCLCGPIINFGGKNMKKTILIPLFIALSATALVGCKKDNNNNNTDSSGPADAQDLGPNFNADYYPKKEDNNVANIIGKSTNMKIDIAINFEDKADAWRVVADEYERLCGGVVKVNLVTGLDVNSYTERLRNEEQNPNTDWDIVQGNLMNSPTAHAVDLKTTITSSKNPYAGNKIWSSFLEEEAYTTDKSGSSDFGYYLNTENLSTAWFVNTAATTKAGVTNTNPQTWDQLIDMLEKLQQAGYKYPLGLTLSKDGIAASQFSWLIRVYGDYFFRDNYIHTSMTFDNNTKTDSTFVYNKASENIESSAGFSFSKSRCLETMLDDSCEYFVGPGSDKYNDFLYQLGRLGKYVKPSAYSLNFNEVRTSFKAQSDGNNGDEAPQVMLDYTGEGLSFLGAPKLRGNIDFFDYPTIVSTEVPDGTLTRDVGGNGGYLALLNSQNKKQTDLNKDFLKFFLSPYGQSIYYKALSEKNFSPQGLTTVKNELVIIPADWVTFFQNDRISFTGLADNNSHLNYGAYRLLDSTEAENKVIELYQKFITPSPTINVAGFSETLYSTFRKCYRDICGNYNWPEDAINASHYNEPDYLDK